jgi:hypothetical protein
MFSNTSASGSGWAEIVFQAKFGLEGVLLPVVGSVGILGEWYAFYIECQVLTNHQLYFLQRAWKCCSSLPTPNLTL